MKHNKRLLNSGLQRKCDSMNSLTEHITMWKHVCANVHQLVDFQCPPLLPHQLPEACNVGSYTGSADKTLGCALHIFT